ncbi:hypothetical protein RRG08_011069 [Elysia crispata]|uniref:Uncharacterized protein n=1 Tax=Elysia crispata TaxID=231223 RepID=A0AAE0ZAP8_9GAST|nr:hypothetical protein RRG08_011069 [Elysia crispata]
MQSQTVLGESMPILQVASRLLIHHLPDSTIDESNPSGSPATGGSSGNLSNKHPAVERRLTYLCEDDGSSSEVLLSNFNVS